MITPGWKQKHFDILCSVDDVCRENGINLYLADDTALGAYRGEGLSDHVTVCIDVADAKRFIEAMKSCSWLALRGMFNFYRYAGFDIKVYDPKTLDYNVTHFEDYGFHALYLTVKFIHHVPDKRVQAVNAGRVKSSYRNYIERKYDRRWRKLTRRMAAFSMIGKVVPADKMTTNVFDYLVKTYSKPSKYITLSSYKYKSSMLAQSEKVSIYGREFRIPGKASTLFSVRYGPDWKRVPLREFVENSYNFRESDKSWDDYLEYAGYLNFDDYYDNIADLYDLGEDLENSRQIIDESTNMLIRTHFRYLLWVIYMPQKQELMDLYEKKEYKELRKRLHKYIIAQHSAAKKKIGICFDPELFEVLVETLRNTGDADLADRIVTMIPEEHKEVIRLKNYEGEYI